jgi:23S rRNA (adenine2503-C2)-methyltransferase
MENLFGKTLEELKTVVNELGLPAYTAKQIADWLYKKHISSIDDMTNLSKDAREKLNTSYQLGLTPHSKVQASVDGTRKYLYPTTNNNFIETAYIPEESRATLCVSSQVGCKMGCLFCMTGKQGFQANLSTGEIVNQIKSLPEFDKLTNIVYMGMGEPFDNLRQVMNSLDILTSNWGFAMSPKRITVSTIGIVPAMKEFLENSECHLAVSLHTPFDSERRELMPIQNVYSLFDVLSEIKSWDFGRQRRISFEYIMFKGFNDSNKHVKEMARVLDGIKCRVNLIKFHPIPGTPLLGSDEETMESFKNALSAKGITTTVRRSRGEDIYAACGLLSTKELIKKDDKDY